MTILSVVKSVYIRKFLKYGHFQTEIHINGIVTFLYLNCIHLSRLFSHYWSPMKLMFLITKQVHGTPWGYYPQGVSMCIFWFILFMQGIEEVASANNLKAKKSPPSQFLLSTYLRGTCQGVYSPVTPEKLLFAYLFFFFFFYRSHKLKSLQDLDRK